MGWVSWSVGLKQVSFCGKYSGVAVDHSDFKLFFNAFACFPEEKETPIESKQHEGEYKTIAILFLNDNNPAILIMPTETQ